MHDSTLLYKPSLTLAQGLSTHIRGQKTAVRAALYITGYVPASLASTPLDVGNSPPPLSPECDN